MEPQSFAALRKTVLEKYPDVQLNQKHPGQIIWFLFLRPSFFFFSNWIIHAVQSGRTFSMILDFDSTGARLCIVWVIHP